MKRVGHLQSDPAAKDDGRSAVESAELFDLVNEQLSPLDATVLAIRLEGFKLKEIAEKIGRSEKTVGRILARVRRVLSHEV